MERIYVRFPNWVGDVVMATSLLSELRRASAGAKMGVALRDYLSPLLWGICAEDEILPVSRPDEHSLLPLFQWQRRLRERAFDAAFIMPPSFSSALAPFMARIPIRAGWAENGRSALLTHAIKRIKPFHSQKMLEQYGLLLKAVFPRANQSLPAPKLRVTGRHERLAAEARKRCGLGELGRPLVVFAASGARGPAKRFIPSRFGAVADTLHRRLGGSFVLAGGGPGDAAELHAVRGFAGHSIQGVFVGDKANGLAELMGLLAQADLVIGNDTGTLHVALDAADARVRPCVRTRQPQSAIALSGLCASPLNGSLPNRRGSAGTAKAHIVFECLPHLMQTDDGAVLRCPDQVTQDTLGRKLIAAKRQLGPELRKLLDYAPEPRGQPIKSRLRLSWRHGIALSVRCRFRRRATQGRLTARIFRYTSSAAGNGDSARSKMPSEYAMVSP